MQNFQRRSFELTRTMIDDIGLLTRGLLNMTTKLGIGDQFPDITLDLVGGGELFLREGMDAKYNIVLFYRCHW